MTTVALQEHKELSLLGELELSGNLTLLGFSLPTDITFDRYEAIGRLFGTAHEALKFAIGDWLLEGTKVFGDDVYQAAEATGISKVSLMQYVRVAERIQMERRHPLLTWSHHRAVVALEPDEQDLWLKRAAESDWSKSVLEEHIREQKPEPVTTVVREHTRRLPGYVVEVVCDAAERIYAEREALEDGDYKVPRDPMLALERALGAPIES